MSIKTKLIVMLKILTKMSIKYKYCKLIFDSNLNINQSFCRDVFSSNHRMNRIKNMRGELGNNKKKN